MDASGIGALLGIAIFGVGEIALSAEEFDLGKEEYESNCVVCHGPKGKGDGPYSAYLIKTPSDLTLISKKNKGSFPFMWVYRIIDGRLMVGAHGTREMPIWGNEYIDKAAPEYDDSDNADPENFVRARVRALTDYIYRLQTK